MLGVWRTRSYNNSKSKLSCSTFTSVPIMMKHSPPGRFLCGQCPNLYSLNVYFWFTIDLPLTPSIISIISIRHLTLISLLTSQNDDEHFWSNTSLCNWRDQSIKRNESQFMCQRAYLYTPTLNFYFRFEDWTSNISNAVSEDPLEFAINLQNLRHLVQ